MRAPYAIGTIFLAVVLIQATDGLKCYICTSLTHDGKLVAGYDGSCDAGSTPANRYLQECNSRSAIRTISETGGDGFQLNNTVSSIVRGVDISTKQNYVWGCVKVSGKQNRNGVEEEIAIRGCLGYSDKLKEECKKKKLKDWRSDKDVMSQFVSGVITADQDTKISGCYCTGAECNPAPSSASFSVMLLLGSAALAFSKYVL